MLIAFKESFRMIPTIAENDDQKGLAITAIIWKPLSSNRSDHSNHMETTL